LNRHYKYIHYNWGKNEQLYIKAKNKCHYLKHFKNKWEKMNNCTLKQKKKV